MLVYGEGKLSGMPPRSVYLYVVHAYRQIFVFQRYGYGTALLWILFIVVVLLTALVFWSSKYWVYQEQPAEEEKK